MGTTGGDRAKLVRLHSHAARVWLFTHRLPQEAEVLQARTYAVIAPQMGKQLVAFQVRLRRVHDRVACVDGLATRCRLLSS